MQLVLLTVAALGAALFAAASGLAELAAARALIGIGSSGALMAGLKALVAKVPKPRLALANGLYIMAGGLGATAATLPVQWLVEALGWRGAFAVLAAATAVAAGWIAALPRQAAAAGPGRGLGLAGLALVFAWRGSGASPRLRPASSAPPSPSTACGRRAGWRRSTACPRPR